MTSLWPMSRNRWSRHGTRTDCGRNRRNASTPRRRRDHRWRHRRRQHSAFARGTRCLRGSGGERPACLRAVVAQLGILPHSGARPRRGTVGDRKSAPVGPDGRARWRRGGIYPSRGLLFVRNPERSRRLRSLARRRAGLAGSQPDPRAGRGGRGFAWIEPPLGRRALYRQ